MSVLWKVIGAILLGFSGLHENEQESGPVGYVDQSGGRLGQSSQANVYYLSVSQATWDKAVDDCKAHFNGKGQLLFLNSQDKLKWAAEKLRSKSEASGQFEGPKTPKIFENCHDSCYKCLNVK